ncbi:MAG: DUF1987 domain-containing protein [Spirochaetes bacterium]|nr:DUF1987 domain-containing protein [Spirochaetota bacterium]
MENMYIKAEKSSPLIDFNCETGRLQIRGISYPEYAARFYDPVINWVTNFLKESDHPIILELNLSYLNTSSTKMIINLFELLEKAYHNGRDVKINWYYDPENEIGYDCGEEFKEDLDLPFNVIEEEI